MKFFKTLWCLWRIRSVVKSMNTHQLSSVGNYTDQTALMLLYEELMELEGVTQKEEE